MGRFLVEHRHDPDRCPAGDSQKARRLRQLLSPAAAHSRGLDLRAEAVERGAHRLVVIVEAGDEAAVRDYLAPFAQAGTLRVVDASSCDEVVRRGAC